MAETPDSDSRPDSAPPKPAALTPEQIREIAAADRMARAQAAEAEIVAALQRHGCELVPEVHTTAMPGNVFALRAGFRIVPR